MVRISRTRRQSIVIVAIVGTMAAAGAFFAIYQQSTGLCACPLILAGSEALNMDSFQFNNSTSLTMTIRNTGLHTVSLTAYRVEDYNLNQYTSFGWSGPTMPVSTIVVVNVAIDGHAFTFQPRTSYTVTMLTARNDQFVFTVITAG